MSKITLFVLISSNELRITIEAFGHEHKEEIVAKLEKAGLRPRIVKVNI